MWGLVVGGLIAGTVILVRVLRQTRAGQRISESLRGMTIAERASVVFAVAVFTLVGSSMAAAWVAWQIENARIIAEVKEPRSRPAGDSAPASDRDHTLPTFTMPDLSVPTTPGRSNPAP